MGMFMPNLCVLTLDDNVLKLAPPSKCGFGAQNSPAGILHQNHVSGPWYDMLRILKQGY